MALDRAENNVWKDREGEAEKIASEASDRGGAVIGDESLQDIEALEREILGDKDGERREKGSE